MVRTNTSLFGVKFAVVAAAGPALVAVGASRAEAAGVFLNVTSATGSTLTGTLGNVTMTRTVASANFALTGVDADSPQYSYSNIYTPATATDNAFSYTSNTWPAVTGTLTYTFSSPVTNLVYDLGNLDSDNLTPVLTGGVTGVALLSGNGGSGDGLGLKGNRLST